jgi:replicative DNA helicase
MIMSRRPERLDDRRRDLPTARLLPHDLDAEESLLGAMLITGRAIEDAAPHIADGTAFYRPAHGHIYDAVCALYRNGNPRPDPVTVSAHLRSAGLLDHIGGPSALVALVTGCASTTAAGHYAAIVAAHHRRRTAIAALHDAQEALYAGAGDIDLERIAAAIGTPPGPADEWPEPGPLRVTPTLPDIDLELLPRPLAELARSVSASVQVAPELVALPGLSVLCAAAPPDATVELRPGFTVPLTMWTATLAGPGEGKSPALKFVADPLHAIERAELAQFAANKGRRNHALAIAERELKSAERGAINYDDSLHDALEDAIAASKPPRRLIDDITTEQLAVLLEHNPRLALLSAEPSLFAVAAGKYSQSGPSWELLLKTFNAEPHRFDRRNTPEPVILESPRLIVGMSVQPVAWERLANSPGARDQGLIARFLTAWPAGRVGYRVPNPPPVDRHAIARWASIVELIGQAQNCALRWSSDAAAVFADWSARTEHRMRPTGDLAAVVAFASKADQHIARLSGAFHLGDGTYGPIIGADVVERACVLFDWLLVHAVAISGSVTEAFVDPAMDSVIAHLRGRALTHDWDAGPLEVTGGTIAHALRRGPAAESWERCVSRLVDASWLRDASVHRTGPKGGRPGHGRWQVSPRIVAPGSGVGIGEVSGPSMSRNLPETSPGSGLAGRETGGFGGFGAIREGTYRKPLSDVVIDTEVHRDVVNEDSVSTGTPPSTDLYPEHGPESPETPENGTYPQVVHCRAPGCDRHTEWLIRDADGLVAWAACDEHATADPEQPWEPA